MAGILNCRGDWCAVIDVDLQDPPEVIEELFAKAREGYDVVTARRASREGETLTKRVVSEFGYSVINRLADVQIPRNTGDFRLMSRRVIEELRGLSESHGFLRGLVALIGAMCYAEIATAFPQVGGTYVYLSEGLGRNVGAGSRPIFDDELLPEPL